MAKRLIKRSTIVGWADAIRAKNGITAKLDPANFSSEILSIGQAPTMQTLIVINSNNQSETATFMMPYGYTFGDFVGSEYDTSGGKFTAGPYGGSNDDNYRYHYNGFRLTLNGKYVTESFVASGVFYYEGESATTYQLSGTWLFNETVDCQNRIEQEDISLSVNGYYDSISIVSVSDGMICLGDGNTLDATIYLNGWLKESYRTFTFNGTNTVSKEFYEWFTANTVKHTPTIISFTIDGTAYQAEDGMTWADFVDSAYNSKGLYLHNLTSVRDSVRFDDDPTDKYYYRVSYNSTGVYGDEIIISGREYTLEKLENNPTHAGGPD